MAAPRADQEPMPDAKRKLRRKADRVLSGFIRILLQGNPPLTRAKASPERPASREEEIYPRLLPPHVNLAPSLSAASFAQPLAVPYDR